MPVKKRLQKVQREELEKVQARMTLCTSIAKRFKKLIPMLQPGSKTLRNLPTLQENVREVDVMPHTIIGAFGEGCISANLEAHYVLGVKVILTDPQSPQLQSLQSQN